MSVTGARNVSSMAACKSWSMTSRACA